jgi:hypothetical protein
VVRNAKPPPAITPVFSAAKWASLDEAFAWAEGALGSDYLAEDDLTGRLRSGQFPLAMLHRRDGVDTFELLETSLLKSLQVVEAEYDGVLLVRLWGLPAEIADLLPHFFVAREPLEQLYSPGPVIDPASDAPPMASGAPPRHKPGPPPIKGWRTVVARELIRRAYAGQKKPTPAAMVRFCQNEIKHSPDPSDMAKWLKQLL